MKGCCCIRPVYLGALFLALLMHFLFTYQKIKVHNLIFVCPLQALATKMSQCSLLRTHEEEEIKKKMFLASRLHRTSDSPLLPKLLLFFLDKKHFRYFIVASLAFF